jgi:hypothetical protein
MIVCICHPTPSGRLSLEDHSSRPAQQISLQDPILREISWVWCIHPSSSLLSEAQNRRIEDQTNLGKKWDSISKATRAKRTKDVAQVVDHLCLASTKPWIETPVAQK